MTRFDVDPLDTNRNRLKSARADPCWRALIAGVDAEPRLVLSIWSAKRRACAIVGWTTP